MRITRQIVNWLAGRRTSPKVSAGSVGDGLLHTWTDAQLYAVWRATGRELGRAAESPPTITVAQARQLLIAEIERRYPAPARAWLATGAALTGEPPEFLRGHDNS